MGQFPAAERVRKVDLEIPFKNILGVHHIPSASSVFFPPEQNITDHTNSGLKLTQKNPKPSSQQCKFELKQSRELKDTSTHERFFAKKGEANTWRF